MDRSPSRSVGLEMRASSVQVGVDAEGGSQGVAVGEELHAIGEERGEGVAEPMMSTISSPSVPVMA